MIAARSAAPGMALPASARGTTRAATRPVTRMAGMDGGKRTRLMNTTANSSVGLPFSYGNSHSKGVDRVGRPESVRQRSFVKRRTFRADTHFVSAVDEAYAGAAAAWWISRGTG